ncbi:hypothetical protein L7F22_052593 [Adiantum nelumboides]|nr:hypothetical protein [Adiantum nelumboides]
MGVVLLPSIVTPPEQLQLKENSLLTSRSRSSVKLALRTTLDSGCAEVFSGQGQRNHGNTQHLNRLSNNEKSALQARPKSGLKEGLSKIHGNNQALERILDGGAVERKVQDVLDRRGWNEAVSQLENEFKQFKFVSARKLVYLLQGCNDTDGFERCQQVQKYAILTGHGSNIFLYNNLVDVYSQCGSLLASCMVFSSMGSTNVFSWTAIILAHVKHDEAETAVLLFSKMLETGVVPDKVLFMVVLKACANLMSPEAGWKLHAFVVGYGFESDSHVGSSLIFMHAEFGSLCYAQIVFNKLKEPSIVAWNTLIMGYAEGGFSNEAFALFRGMQMFTDPDDVTLLSVLKACINSEDLNVGMDVHAQAIANGLDMHLFVGSSLVDMYAKCGGIEHAYAFFKKLDAHDVVSWTAMITAFAQPETWDLTLDLFEQMQLKRAALPNELTYASVLCACSGLRLEEKGRVMHTDIVKCGFELDIFIASSLISMYADCGCLDDASHVFCNVPTPNVITYNSMLAGYAQQGAGERAVKLYEKMEREGLRPDAATFVSVLKSCCIMKALGKGQQVHLQIVKDGIELDSVVASHLVVLYCRCGSMKDSQVVFESMQERDIALWNTIIAGYLLHGPLQMAFSLFERMQKNGCNPNAVTFVSILKSCASLSGLDQGQHFFMHLVKIGIGSDLLLDSTLVDFFAKCGRLEDAAHLFTNMRKHDVVSYTAMIAAYAQQGRAKEAVSLFEQMKQERVQPNEITFLGVLNACNHVGLVLEAIQYFKSMRNDYKITPTARHCTCLIDLLARAGHHVEAMDALSHLPDEIDKVTWLALLGSCKTSSNAEVARHTADHVLEQNSKLAAPYVLLSNISAE